MSPLIAQRHDLIGEFEKVGIRVLQAVRPVPKTLRIHVIAWEELPRGHTDNTLRPIVIANRAEEPEQREAARRGAAAIIAVDQLQEDLVAAILSVAAGYYPMPYRIMPALVTRLDAPPPRVGADDLALLNRLLQGANITEVAAVLKCSERHARRKLRTLWDQMGVSGRREGLTTAARWGLGQR